MQPAAAAWPPPPSSRLVRCYCSKEMNEEFPACTDKDCNDLIRLNQELRRDMERYLSI